MFLLVMNLKYDIYMILYSVRYIYVRYGASFVELKNMYHQI